jgi:hypothetical protein
VLLVLLVVEMEAASLALQEADQEAGRYACPHYKRKCKFVVSTVLKARYYVFRLWWASYFKNVTALL